jgi:predicted  nucleic acid-binding Zn-ribbon protein
LFKAEHAKLEDEVSSVTNSLSKLGDEILAIRQDMTKTQQHFTGRASGVQKYPVKHE